MKHTEGEWKIHREVLNSPQPEYIYGGENNTHICDFRKLNPNLIDEILEQQQANAKLIAAAPDLLAACEAYKRHCELHDNSDQPKANMFCTGCSRYRKQIEAAIAKTKRVKDETI